MVKFDRLLPVLGLLAGLFWFAPAAEAQGCGPSNPNCIVPTAPVGTSDNRAASTAFVQNTIAAGIPYTAITGLPANRILGSIPGGAAQALTPTQITTFCDVFTAALKGCVPAPGSVTGRYLGDNQAWNALPNQALVQGSGITLTGTCSGQALNCTVAASTTVQLTLASRAFAATQNLSTLSVVSTLGYATPGDGGGATFKNVGSAQFLDSHIVSGSITAAGSGYTNGTYRDIQMSGGTGVNAYVNITIAGGVVTSVTIVQHGGNGYTVGDVLSTSAGNIGGTGSGFTWTVSAISTPLASFTDSVGTRWQYVVDAGNLINVRQFGAKFDFNGIDASATDDYASIQAAINFASNRTSNANPHGGGGAGSAIVMLPHGSAKVCGPLVIYDSTNLAGQGMFNSTLKVCDSGMSAASHFVTLCDPNIQLACFGAKISDLTLSATTSAAANNAIAMLFSNNVQQSAAVKSVAVYAGLRHCFRYTNGYGGAAKVEIYDFFCTMNTASVNDGVSIDPTTTVNITFNGGLIVEAGGAGSAINAVNWASGNLFINGFHTEGVTTGIIANATVSTYQASLHGATGGNGCTELVKLQATNTLGNFVIGTSQVNGCTRLITNGQPGGANFAGNTVKDIVCNPGAPCAP